MQIRRLLRTVRYIKLLQLVYQIKNRIGRDKLLLHYKSINHFPPSALRLITLPPRKNSAEEDGTFNFLNLGIAFRDRIDWNYAANGKLWNYNLQYLDFINQENLSDEVVITWIRDLYMALDSGSVKLEPYPVSLRTMNIIRYFCTDQSRISRYGDILESLKAELTYLHGHYEYHLFGNHLLENAFSMLMGGYFFNNQSWQMKASQILKEQLAEQVLNDGAHFELSPMYHQIILFRVLEAISYLPTGDEIAQMLAKKASLMLGWLQQISFKNGAIPHFNDSSDDIAFNTAQLLNLADLLNVEPQETVLSDSGYRKFEAGTFELIADVHGISPVYQPGHNHSDHLSFVLHVKGEPFIVDTGTSTYNISERRQWERSSAAHNTVTIGDRDQSEVWAGFRVGRRARVRIIKDVASGVTANVDYSGLKHTREFSVSDSCIAINDCLNSSQKAIARFYLDPLASIINSSPDTLSFSNGVIMKFSNACELRVEEYEMATGFNTLVKSKVIEVHFTNTCTSTILIN